MLASDSNNVHFEMAVWNKFSDSDSVHLIPPVNKFFRSIVKLIALVDRRLGFDGLLNLGHIFILRQKYFKSADVVHLHMIHGDSNFSIFSLYILSKFKPVVWTIHDKWATTGYCEHPGNCMKWMNFCLSPCPHPRSKSLFGRYLSGLHYSIKRFVYNNSDFEVIVSNEWMCEYIKSTPLLCDKRIHVVPFAVTHQQNEHHHISRNIVGTDSIVKTIAFRDSGASRDPIKGTNLLLQALKDLNYHEKIRLLVFEDATRSKMFTDIYDVVAVGWADQEDVLILLKDATVFVMPSLQESFGMMALEAMYVGTPVICFDDTPMADIVHDSAAGIVVEKGNIQKLSESILKVLMSEDLATKCSMNGSYYSREHFNYDNYINKHIEIYNRLMLNG